MKAQSTFSLKDQLFNADRVEYLATSLEQAYPEFPGVAFRASVLSAFPALELKQRIAHICDVLHASLPGSYREALDIIVAALPPALDPDRTDDDFGDFIFAPLSLFVATYGCTAEHLHASLAALREITQRFSAEDAIRYFINAFPAQTLAFLSDCAADEHYHVRRLASEGTRPFLPWSQRLSIDYREPLPILEVLFADRTRYVTRSVANHLNDVSKLDPQLVVDTLERWAASGRQTPDEMAFMMKHALRTLLRQGHVEALQLMGFTQDAVVTVLELTTSTPQVQVGDAFRFALTLRAHRAQKLLLDYVITFPSDRPTATRKVFRLKQVELASGESVTIEKTHPMRLMTTRRLQAGKHQVTLQVNGKPMGALAFELVAP